MNGKYQNLMKPILRGHFHQSAFFFALGACLMLLEKTYGSIHFSSIVVYSLCITLLFGISALYHRPNWGEKMRSFLRRLDHAAIYLTIAGTGTPVLLITLNPEVAHKVLWLTWATTFLGIIQCLVWIHAPKWFNTLLYLAAGWIIVPYWRVLSQSIPSIIGLLILIGGVFYSLGALIYAFKRPNPFPRYFGYHEIFHLLVIIGAFFHFIAINKLINTNL